MKWNLYIDRIATKGRDKNQAKPIYIRGLMRVSFKTYICVWYMAFCDFEINVALGINEINFYDSCVWRSHMCNSLETVKISTNTQKLMPKATFERNSISYESQAKRDRRLFFLFLFCFIKTLNNLRDVMWCYTLVIDMKNQWIIRLEHCN